MTASVASLLALLFVAGPAARAAKVDPPKAEGTKLEQGQKLFASGDFEGALKALDAAAQESKDDATLEKVHLLRAQCFAARQDFVRAEEAFAQALEADPEASLDPARVDPTVVKMLDAVRNRLTGSLVLESTPPGASVTVDGKDAGLTPQALPIAIGRHRLELRWEKGPLASSEVVVKPGREAKVTWVQGPVTQLPPPPCPAAPAPGPTPRPLRPFADVRASFEVPVNPGAYVTGGFEVGGGLEVWWFRLGLWARLFPAFGLTPRLAFAVPVAEKFNVLIELGLPVLFLRDGTGVGLWGTGGAEYYPLRWLGLWAAAGARHYFQWPGRNDPTAFTVTGGARLRMP
ncbi:MAG: PEGA domain-containing protein [Myxococcales bacterium]|nr:PEGA domain-containing protein [Myxococcales bacterium]